MHSSRVGEDDLKSLSAIKFQVDSWFGLRQKAVGPQSQSLALKPADRVSTAWLRTHLLKHTLLLL